MPIDGECIATMATDRRAKRLPATQGTVNAAGCSAYGQSALERETGAVTAAREGERNDRLNRAAFALGQLVAGGELTEGAAQDALARAARACGLPDGEATKTIASGMKAGADEPRTAPERPATTGAEPDDSVPEAHLPEDDGLPVEVYEVEPGESGLVSGDTAPEQAPRLRTLGSILPDAIKLAERRRNGDEKPIPLPWPEYEAALGGGMWPGMHVTVAGTAMGKTALALLISLGAVKVGVPVAYVGLELDDAQIALRVTGEHLGMRWSDLYLGSATTEKLRQAKACAPELSALPFYVETGPPGGWPPSNLYGLAKGMREQHPDGPMALVVDFLQLVGPEHDTGRVELRERISQAAYIGRDVARRFGVVVLLISSTARDKYNILNSDLRQAGLATWQGRYGPEKLVANPAPLIGLGKESGEIEYAADSTTVLSRWPAPLDNGDSAYILAVPKLRYGRERWMALAFSGGRFTHLPVDSVAELPEVNQYNGRAKVTDDELRERLRATVRTERPSSRADVLSHTEGDRNRLATLWSAMVASGDASKVDGVYQLREQSTGGGS